MCGTMKTGAMVVVVGVDEVISRALCQSEAISYTVYFPIRSPHTFGTLHHAIFSSPLLSLELYSIASTLHSYRRRRPECTGGIQSSLSGFRVAHLRLSY